MESGWESIWTRTRICKGYVDIDVRSEHCTKPYQHLEQLSTECYRIVTDRDTGRLRRPFLWACFPRTASESGCPVLMLQERRNLLLDAGVKQSLACALWSRLYNSWEELSLGTSSRAEDMSCANSTLEECPGRNELLESLGKRCPEKVREGVALRGLEQDEEGATCSAHPPRPLNDGRFTTLFEVKRAYTSATSKCPSPRPLTRCFNSSCPLNCSKAHCYMPGILRSINCFWRIWCPTQRPHASDSRTQPLPKVANPP
jgi:hypothetical protein